MSETAAKSGKRLIPGLGVLDVLFIISSSFYWAWFDTATFRPTLFLGGNIELYPAFLVSTMAAGAAFLLLAYFKSDRLVPLLALRPYGEVVTAASVLLGVMVCSGSYFGIAPLVVAGGALMGVTCSYFLLEWARLYSGDGARSAGPIMATSVALGVGIDFLVSGMSSLPAAIFCLALPIVAASLLGIFDMVVRKASSEEANLGTRGQRDHFPPTVGESEEPHAEGNMLIWQGSRTLLGLPIGLLLSFAVFGFSFGLTVFLASTDSVSQLASPDILLLIRGGTCLVILALMSLFPQKLYSIFKVGMFVGLAGFVVSPAMGAVLGSSQIVSCGVTVIGYTTFDVMTWSVLSEIAHANRDTSARVFGPGRFAVHLGVALGFTVGFCLNAAGLLDRLSDVVQTTVGYLVAIATTPFIGNASALETIPRTIEQVVVEPKPTLADFAAEHGLTQRETEILEHLAMGRSRPRIAETFGISENTVGSHIKHIYDKLGIHSTQEAIDLLNPNSK